MRAIYQGCHTMQYKQICFNKINIIDNHGRNIADAFIWNTAGVYQVEKNYSLEQKLEGIKINTFVGMIKVMVFALSLSFYYLRWKKIRLTCFIHL